MATTNLIANINKGLDRIENHIRGVGTPMQNPANVIDGIRGSLNYTCDRNLLRVKAEFKSLKPKTKTRPKFEIPAKTKTLAETSKTGQNVQNPSQNCLKLAETS